MNRFFIFLTGFLVCVFSFIHGREHDWDKEREYFDHPKEIMITEQEYTLGDIFDVDSSFGHLGHVIKEKFTITGTYYDYYQTKGGEEFKARAYINPISWGSFFKWATVLEIYNPSGILIGKIKGCMLTTSPSKFNFYNGDGKLLGTAYMDNNKMGFSIECESDGLTIAKYTRMHVPEKRDYWYLTIYENDIPPAFLVLFGAWAVDKQDHFKVDD